jgi:hypothetical protein
VKVVVYTALFGDTDKLWSVPPVVVQGARYIAFTEKPRREVGLWTYDFGIDRPRVLEGTEGVSPVTCHWEQVIVKAPYESRKSARYYKVMAHKVLKGVDISIWIDANVRLLLPPREAVTRWASMRDLVVFKHSIRSCLFEEVDACLRLGKGNKDVLITQGRAYKEAGMPRKWGLATTRCLVRKHTPTIAKLNKAWWKEIRQYSLRDQISLPFVCWEEGFEPERIPKSIRYNKDFWFIPHKGVISRYV